MIKLLPEVDTPEKLNKFLNTFDYAKGMDVSVYAKLYKFPTEEEFIRDKGGICWDYANYEMYYLKLLGFKPRFFYIEDVSNEVDIINHTFVIFPDGYNFKWIESSWNGNKGIFSYFSLNEALIDIPVIKYDLSQSEKYTLKVDDATNEIIIIDKATTEIVQRVSADDLSHFVNYLSNSQGSIVNRKF